ncbi:TRAP transporter large permease [Zwartia vadi]|uniref:TRAP transporter large permease n=1 Tax=Zwartia vadi TaxID=3058168 RepID=UPI0025B45257|nr:TRAP transporter large permease subunit [Zwartia vadi]MDN3987284.1 TRAP transporter large permease subunit [Zwartia vadi]
MKLPKAIWFGFSCIAIVVMLIVFLTPWGALQTGHVGLIMLALIVVAIMLGFPTAFTLMGMGVIFTFLAYIIQSPDMSGKALNQTLTLMVQRTYATMTNDALISIPLFVFMGYLVERANLIEKLFKALHLALARLPGSLAIATLITCAIFATATGIVGAVVTLMGLLAMPAMLKAGYSVRLTAGVITAGGCLGILIPPSVMLIVYGATTGTSVVKLYAGALLPGIGLAVLYAAYVMLVAKIWPDMAPALPEKDRQIPLPPGSEAIKSQGYMLAATGLLANFFKTPKGQPVSRQYMNRNALAVMLPLLVALFLSLVIYRVATEPKVEYEVPAELQLSSNQSGSGSGLAEPPSGLAEPPSSDAPVSSSATSSNLSTLPESSPSEGAEAQRLPAPNGFWIYLGIAALIMLVFYVTLTWARLEVFKMLMGSFFPLSVLIGAVLGSIGFGLATPSEAAAMGALGGALLALAYGRLNMEVLKESTFLTAKTSAMVCWLFVGSSIFSAAFALLGGQKIIEDWVLSLGLTSLEFMLLAQILIFILGWPLEWTEIIVIFMPIFVPLLAQFNIDPLFFGLLVALNLQTAFLSPPVAMAAFYLKGVSPPHVSLNQIFLGMLPFMGIQIVAIVLLYTFPAIGLWLPEVLYK